MNALEFNNKIANLITGFIANIPIIELVNLNYQLNPNDHSSQLNITLRNTLTYHESDFNYYITYSQYLD